MMPPDVEALAEGFARRVRALPLKTFVPGQGLQTSWPLVEVRRAGSGSVYVTSGQLFRIRFADHPPRGDLENVTHDCWGRGQEAISDLADLAYRKVAADLRRKTSRALFAYWGACAGHDCSAVALDAHSR